MSILGNWEYYIVKLICKYFIDIKLVQLENKHT